jgi:hypothetical protein
MAVYTKVVQAKHRKLSSPVHGLSLSNTVIAKKKHLRAPHVNVQVIFRFNLHDELLLRVRPYRAARVHG